MKVLVHLLYKNKTITKRGTLRDNVLVFDNEKIIIDPDKIVYRIKPRPLLGPKIIPMIYLDGKTKIPVDLPVSDSKYNITDEIVHNNANLRMLFLTATFLQEQYERLRRLQIIVFVIAGIIIAISLITSAYVINETISGLHDIANALREYINKTTAPPIK